MGGNKPCVACDEPLLGHTAEQRESCREARRQQLAAGKKRCSKCRRTRPGSKFVNDATRADGKFPWCVDCQGDVSKLQDPEGPLTGNDCPVCDTPLRGFKLRKFCSDACKYKAKRLRDNYGLTVEQYRQMVDATGGECPLCGSRPKMWAVDHVHRTRKVTGVVCTRCNVTILAACRHSLDRARRLVAYLEQTPAERLGIEAFAPEGADKPTGFTPGRGFMRAVQ